MSHPRSRQGHLRSAKTDDGGLAVYNPASDEGHLLNLTAATVYQLADGTRSIETLAEEVAARTGAPAEPDMVLLALEDLDRAGLLEADASPRPATDRRRFLLKLGLVASAAALVPLVETVTRVSHAASTAVNAAGNQSGTTLPPTTRPIVRVTQVPARGSISSTSGY